MRVRLRDIPVRELPKSKLTPFYGVADRGVAWVRSDLNPRIKKHVSLHERIHVKYNRGEIITNLLAGAMDPKGWMLTVIATLKDKERKEYYKIKAKRFFKKSKQL